MVNVTRRIQREALATVFSNGRRRPVVVELSPPGDVIHFRLKGERTAYPLPLDWCYRTAAMMAARQMRQEKRHGKHSHKR